jgi:aminoglycoside phosphotransferase (APT) family kinase protein
MSTGGNHELAQRLSVVLGVSDVTDLVRLSGGASRETWRFVANGESFVLQRVRKGTVGGFRTEPLVLAAAHHLGVPTPELVINGADSDALDLPFMIVRAVEGETIARKILRDDQFAHARSVLPEQLGRAAALLHSIDLSSVPGLEAEDQVERYRDALLALGEPHPVFEATFRWLQQNQPESSNHCVVHGDFRLGNIMVDSNGLSAVLDWELAHVGDPMEDLGWLCVRAWRFGGSHPAAGLGSYDQLFDAYETVAGKRPDHDVVRWWEILGTLKWGIICISQAATHLNGVVRSHELAAIGRRVCENEYDLIDLLTESAV